MITALEHAGVDTISIDAGQAIQLGAEGFNFDAGTDVLVNGTSFLNNGNSASINAAAALFGDADVTVTLTQSDVQSLVAAGSDQDFDNVITALESAGVDTISIDAGQALQFADAGFTFDADSSVVVHGTAFLSTGDDGGVDPAVKALFGGGAGTQKVIVAPDVHVDLRLSDAEMHHLASDVGAVADLLARASDAGVDAVSTGGTVDLTADLALALREALADADLSLADTDTLRVVSDQLSLAQTRAADFESVVDLATGISQLMDDMAGSGFESVHIDDELANALAEAGVDTDVLPMPELGFQVGVLAQADVGDTAYLRSTLEDLVQSGVDRVESASGVEKVLVALHDSGTASTELASILHGLESLKMEGSPGTAFGLVVTQSDLSYLINNFGMGNAVDVLASAGFTEIVVAGTGADTEVSGTDPGVKLDVVYQPSVYTGVEAQLLGVDADQDPFDPFNPPKP
ncbi:MAG: hypothetical protein WCT47_21705 [Betaproteobacteria bacterium]